MLEDMSNNIIRESQINERKSTNEIRSVAEFLNELEYKRIGILQAINYLKQYEDVTKKVKLYYRGHADEDWELKPSAFREKIKNERDYYYETLTSHPKEFKDLSSIDKLAKMQHYGIPTRLLDITSNPLTALFFACQKKYSITNVDANKDNEPNGKLLIFSSEESLTFDSDRALLLSCLPKMSPDEQAEIQKYVMKKNYVDVEGRISNETLENDKKNGDISELGYGIFKKFVYEAERERTAFAKFNIRSQDLLDTFMVRPQFNNDRIEKQDGLFCIFGLSASLKSSKEIIIPKTFKDMIRNELVQIGFSKIKLFPDLQSFAESLNPKTAEKACAYCGTQCECCKLDNKK